MYNQNKAVMGQIQLYQAKKRKFIFLEKKKINFEHFYFRKEIKN